MEIERHPSPNCGARRNNATPELVVLHYTAMASTEAVLRHLCDASSEVSAHYVIAPDGAVHQLVEEQDRAWHAGAGSWGSVSDVNSHSIGIELCNDAQSPFAAPLMDALEELLADILARWHIPPERVIAHSDMAPMRKRDPGPRFDWRRLALAGLSVWPEVGAGDNPPAEPFLPLARRFGYTADAPAEAILAAFRLRFRPGHSGPEDGADRALAADLAARFPVDPEAPAT